MQFEGGIYLKQNEIEKKLERSKRTKRHSPAREHGDNGGRHPNDIILTNPYTRKKKNIAVLTGARSEQILRSTILLYRTINSIPVVLCTSDRSRSRCSTSYACRYEMYVQDLYSADAGKHMPKSLFHPTDSTRKARSRSCR